jgi:predicted dehydrogenase
MDNKVRIGVVGLGFMGLTHLQAYRNMNNVVLAAVCSSDPKKLAGDLSGISGNLGNSGEQMDFGDAARYPEALSVIEDPRVDAIDLCVPTDLHEQLATAALDAGKHVLIEKPMALDEDACRKMIRASERSSRVIMVGQVLRFWPEYREAHRLVVEGTLGQVRYATFNRRCGTPKWGGWLRDPARSGGGAFDLLIHDFDFALYLFGLPRSIQAGGYLGSDNTIDLVHADLETSDGARVRVSGGWYPGEVPFGADFTIAGDKGTLEFTSAGGKLTFYPTDGTESIIEATGDPFQGELEEFVRCCLAGKPSTICPPEQSAQAVTVTNTALVARSTGSPQSLV